ncbi:MAG TPA: preprotein translocase subunit SecA [Verrucomicrobiae bacterium]|nr:preprotein translocase subunit SecA [Verrucomicrobiae bacterium]
MPHFLDRFLGDTSKNFVRRNERTVARINALEEKMQPLKDEDFAKKMAKWRKEVQEKLESHSKDPLAVLEGVNDRVKEKKQINAVLDELLPEVFALVREAARRTVGQRHFDVQILGGIALHQGNIAEMRTGEGKTLVATLPLVLNTLVGRGVHLVTVNDYLAKTGVELYGGVYGLLGLTVGVITHDSSFRYENGELVPVPRKEAYACDITYGTNNEFGFDYLRDNMAQDVAQLVQRNLFFAIVDEVDSILIDEARTPLIISGPAEESADLYQRFASLVPRLQAEKDYTVDEKDRAVSLTSEGIAKMEQLLGVENIYGEEVQLAYHLEEALKANILFKRDKDYVVRDGEVIIVDEFTGRLMPGRRYSEGLHQAIEAKEGVVVQRESTTMATISFQNLFRLYTKLAGMTGTAATEAEEFMKIYGLEVLTIPTNRPMIRQDLPDQIYRNDAGKYKAVVAEVKRRHEAGQPVLIGTISVERNEHLSELLTKAGIPHEVMNAKNNEREAAIVAQAGRKGAVTLATNIAGRGTDIILGGVPPKRAEFESEKEFEKAVAAWQVEHDAVVEAGGLHVVGTERHESRRIDNQLRGRAGRQGDPGSSQFYISTEDDLMRIFGGDRLKSALTTMGVKEDEAVEHKMITKSIESAQKRVEGHNFDMRKRLIQFDDVLTRHREVIYKRRRKALDNAKDVSDIEETLKEALQHEARHITGLHASGGSGEWNLEQLTRDVGALIGMDDAARAAFVDELSQYHSDAAIEEIVTNKFLETFEHKKKSFGDVYAPVIRSLYLSTVDNLWVEHLSTLQELRTGVFLRQYAQVDPLTVYTSEGYRLFQQLILAIDLQVARTVLRIERVVEQPAGQEASADGAMVTVKEKPKPQLSRAERRRLKK